MPGPFVPHVAAVVLSFVATPAIHLPSSAPAPSVDTQQDSADEAATYVAGLAQKGLNELVVKEGRAFLARYAQHTRATLVRYLVADAEFALEHFTEARPLFEAVASVDGFDQRREARFRLGQCSFELKDPSSAATNFEWVLANDPDYLSAPAGFLLGEARFQLGEFDAAEAAYWGVLQLKEPGAHGFDAACAMCWTAKQRGALDAVVQRVQACIAAAPAGDARVAELWLLLGETQYTRGQHTEALASFEKIPECPQRSAARRGAAFALVALGRDADAAACFEALLAELPSSLPAGDTSASDLRARAASSWVRAGQHQRALTLLERASDATSLYWRGRALSGLARHQEALAAYEAAARARPDEELASLVQGARADALYALGRTAEAAAVYENAGGDYALHAAATARANAGEFDEAARLARELIERFPQSRYLLATQLVLGEALFQVGDHDGARAAFGVVAKSGEAADARRAKARLCWCDFAAQQYAAAESGFAALARGNAETAEGVHASFMAARSAEELGATDPAAIERAVKGFTDFVANAPRAEQRPEALLRLARLVPGEAGEAALVRLVEEHAGHALCNDAWFELAERRSARGATEAARVAYAAALAGGKAELRSAALYGMAWCDFQGGRQAEASASLTELLASKSLDPTLEGSARELVVWVEAARGDGRAAEAAVRRLAQVAALEARAVPAARRAHIALVASGDALRGAELFKHLAATAHDPATVLAARIEEVFARLDAAGSGDERRKTEQLALAETLTRELSRMHPVDEVVAEATFFVAEARWAAGDFTRALQLCDLAAAAGGATRERALYKAGFAATRLGDHAAAEVRLASFAAEFDASPLLGEVLYLLGEARYAQGHDAAAVEALGAMRKRFLKHDLAVPALFRLGLAQARLGQHAEAARSLADLVRAAPDFAGRAEAELARGRALAALGDRRAARAALAAVLERDQGLLAARARLELGELARADGNLDAALGEFLKVAVLYEPCDEVADALVRAGGVLELQGQRDAALARYREVVKDFQGSTFATSAQARIDALGKP